MNATGGHRAHPAEIENPSHLLRKYKIQFNTHVVTKESNRGRRVLSAMAKICPLNFAPGWIEPVDLP